MLAMGCLGWAALAAQNMAAVSGQQELQDETETIQGALDEFLRFVSHDGGRALTLCHLGATEFMFEVTQFLLTELPDTTYVLFFRTPDTVHSVVQQMAETYRGRVHLLDDLDSFDGYCSVTLLPVSYPFFTVNDI